MKPLILVTNDDGIRAKGLQALVEMVKPFGQVLVVAPEKGHSGQSHAITSDSPLRLREIVDYPESEAKVYACSGTPVDCVKLAMSHLLSEEPDMIVSGVNHGSNSSVSVVYSGTMAAAQEGALYGVPSVGFSLLDWTENPDFTASITVGRKIVQQVMQNGLKRDIALNVNIPVLPLGGIKGVKLCRQANGTWVEGYDKRIDPRGGEYFWLRGDFVNNEPDAQDTDEWALNNGYVSIVPVQPDLTSYSELNRLKMEWNLE
ncbi:MAG: 5'/3'-nucleotidase SurE [Prevotellaceae bacterium]|nr:5'/3'-nucleotidase SurE [Prevotellaceae bacterium]